VGQRDYNPNGMDYMRRALTLARRAQGTTSPRPPVGAVLVRDGQVVGEGATQPPWGPHGEIVALQAAGERARGATLYVTLEPCAHYGRTPPCVDAILRAGVGEVHVPIADGNPQVSGRGFAALGAAGIPLVMEERFGKEAEALAAPSVKYVKTGLPFVIAKFAASLDGKIATRLGDSKWITGPAAQAYGHRVRAEVDAIIAGANTVLADDPALTARPRGRPQRRQPLRVVVDSLARTPPHAQVITGGGECLIAVGARAPRKAVEALERAGASVLGCPGPDQRVWLSSLLRGLAERNCINVLVEGGSELVGSFFDGGFVDRVLAFLAPKIIGGREARPAVGGEGAHPLAAAWRLGPFRLRRLGQDLLIDGLVYRDDASPAPGGIQYAPTTAQE